MAYYPFATEFGAFYKLVGGGVTATFNDPTDPNYVGMLTEVSGLDSPEVRESASDLTQSDGGVHGDFYYGRRPIVLSGRVFGHASVLERNTRLDRARRASNIMRADGVLSWKPANRVENYISNPRAVIDTADWSNSVASVVNSGATITRATGVAPPTGTTAIQVATSGSGNATQGAAIPFQVVAGVTYAVSVAARRTAGTDTYNVSVAGVTTANVVLTASAGSFTTYTTTFTAAASGTAYLRIYGSSTNTLASTFQISDVMVSPGTTTTYRDGDTSGWFWQGTPGGSPSGDFIEMQTWVRRQQPFRESGGWAKDFQIPLVSQYAQMFSAAQSVASAANGSPAAAENRGNSPAFPILRITAPGAGTLANPTVTNSVTGLVFRTTGLTMAANEIIEYDMLSHTGVFTGGVGRSGQSANQFINFATTAWPSLVTGTQNMTLAGTSGGTLTVLWRDAWM